MKRLYWKIFPLLAVTTFLTLVFSVWVSFSVLPAYFQRSGEQKLDSFSDAVMSIQPPTRTRVESLADSLGLSLRFVRGNRQPPFNMRDMPGVRYIQPTGADFSVFARAGVPTHRFTLVLLFTLVVFLSQGIALYLALRPVFARISILDKLSGEFGAGNLTNRYPLVTARDEIDGLGASFNTMADRIASLLNSHTELLNAVAHELRTPMARLQFALELAKEKPESAGDKLAVMEKDLFELDRLVSELLDFNRIGTLNDNPAEPVSLTSVCFSAADAQKQSDSHITITVSGAEEDIFVPGSHRLLLRAVSNVIRNSVQYAESRINIELIPLEHVVQVIVTDDGPGFPPGFSEKAVNPFVKTNDSKGFGLGLSIVKRIVEKHGGTLVLSNKKDLGAKVIISLPKR